MDSYNIYQEISERTQGDIYIGVVGPVRTGKSTFIKKFMDKLVIPNIENEHIRERAIDELPQSAKGRTIMTTEPKFVPNEAVQIEVDTNAKLNVRLIDCVGYVIPNSIGQTEDDMPRMVSTPWSEIPVPFETAAEIGTRKVIKEHSTIGLVITTDGSISEIERENYVEAEEKVINELKEIGKPFIILLNSTNPYSERTMNLQKQMEEKYNASVMSLSCEDLEEKEISEIIERVLFEFPLKEITVKLPSWLNSMDKNHWLKNGMFSSVTEAMTNVCKIRDTKSLAEKLEENDNIEKVSVSFIDLGNGTVAIDITLLEGIFYDMLSEATGIEVNNDQKLLSLFMEFSKIKKEYDKLSSALYDVQLKGYGIVSPGIEELTLEEPEIVKQGNRYGVRLRASAPSIHMIRADIETEVNPIVGTEKQSEELVHYLLKEFDEEPTKIWNSNIFGKSLNELVNEGLQNKLYRMPDDARIKLQETLTKIINEGSGGLICIIL